MELTPYVVVNMSVKFGDHRRWLTGRRVGLTRSHFGRRVAARPASVGAVLCSDMLIRRYEQLSCLRVFEIRSFDRCQSYPKSDRTV